MRRWGIMLAAFAALFATVSLAEAGLFCPPRFCPPRLPCLRLPAIRLGCPPRHVGPSCRSCGAPAKANGYYDDGPDAPEPPPAPGPDEPAPDIDAAPPADLPPGEPLDDEASPSDAPVNPVAPPPPAAEEAAADAAEDAAP